MHEIRLEQSIGWSGILKRALNPLKRYGSMVFCSEDAKHENDGKGWIKKVAGPLIVPASFVPIQFFGYQICLIVIRVFCPFREFAVWSWHNRFISVLHYAKINTRANIFLPMSYFCQLFFFYDFFLIEITVEVLCTYRKKKSCSSNQMNVEIWREQQNIYWKIRKFSLVLKISAILEARSNF